MADWGGGMYVSCTAGPIVGDGDGYSGLIRCTATVSLAHMPISCHLQDSKARAGKWQGRVRGQHGRGLGQGSSRPRPQNFVLEVEASPRGPPSLGFLQRAVMPRRLSVHHSQIQRPTAASCALVYEVLYLWY